LNDLRNEWLRLVEEYYRDKYPKVMRTEVKKLLPVNKKMLRVLFDVVTEDSEAWKRSVKVPDKVALLKAKNRIYLEYPEFRPESYNNQISDNKALLPEETTGMREEVMRQLGELVEKMRNKAGGGYDR
jgi:hypothetical protein